MFQNNQVPLLLGRLLYELSSAGKTITGCLVVRGAHEQELSYQLVEEGLKVIKAWSLNDREISSSW
jgi:hypothetical protein